MTPSKHTFKKVGFIGLVMLAFLSALIAFFPAKADRLPKGFFTPIIAFEFIQSQEEVDTMFRAPDGTLNSDLVDTMDAVNQLDFYYMTLYAIFLMAFAVSVGRYSGRRLYFSAAMIAVAVLFADFGENLQLLGITAKIENGTYQPELARLYILTWIKWGGIAVIFLILFPWFVKGRGFSKLIGFVGVLSFTLGAAAFLHRSILNELFALSVGLMFILMVIYCFVTKRQAIPA